MSFIHKYERFFVRFAILRRESVVSGCYEESGKERNDSSSYSIALFCSRFSLLYGDRYHVCSGKSEEKMMNYVKCDGWRMCV